MQHYMTTLYDIIAIGIVIKENETILSTTTDNTKKYGAVLSGIVRYCQVLSGIVDNKVRDLSPGKIGIVSSPLALRPLPGIRVGTMTTIAARLGKNLSTGTLTVPV
jgi:hypothetical protein